MNGDARLTALDQKLRAEMSSQVLLELVSRCARVLSTHPFYGSTARNSRGKEGWKRRQAGKGTVTQRG